MPLASTARASVSALLTKTFLTKVFLKIIVDSNIFVRNNAVISYVPFNSISPMVTSSKAIM